MTTRAKCAILVLCLTTPSVLWAQEPRSAIEWLSSSLIDPPKFRVTPEQPPILTDLWAVIEKMPIGEDAPLTAGLMTAASAGLPVEFWGSAASDQVASLIAAQPRNRLPSMNDLWRDILLAQFVPPMEMNDGLLIARMDQLIAMGALEQAEALAAQVYPISKAVIEKRFELGLLVNRTTEICREIAARPGFDIPVSIRTICLARAGDWNAAAVTLAGAAMIGDVPRPEEEMLIAFLDPELEDVMTPASRAQNEALDFFLREAIGLPRRDERPALAFRYYDLSVNAPLKARVEASEAFAKAGSFPSPLLFAAYRSGSPSASGGIWDRVAWVQGMDDALFDEKFEQISILLTEGLEQFSSAGIVHLVAQEFHDELLSVRQHLSPRSQNIVFRLALLAGNNPGPISVVEPDARLQLAAAVAGDNVTEIQGSDVVASAIVEGLDQHARDRSDVAEAHRWIEADEVGKAVLAALSLLSEGGEADPNDIRAGLSILMEAGLGDRARRAAIELALSDGWNG